MWLTRDPISIIYGLLHALALYGYDKKPKGPCSGRPFIVIME